MHSQHSRPEGGTSAIAIAFAAGIAIGINITGGPMAAASDVRAPMVAQARALPTLPPEAVAAFAIARRLDALAADASRECAARGDGRCFN